MRSKAKLHDLGIDYESRKIKATFLLDDASATQLEKLNDKVLLLEAKEYKPKKTNDQNAYLWSLLQDMADHVKGGSTKWQQYMRCIREYGVFVYLPAQEQDLPMLESVFRLMIDRGEIEITTPSGKQVTCHQMQCFKGTSKYNKEEMSNFLDKVIAECKDAGIDVCTPEEREHMKSLTR